MNQKKQILKQKTIKILKKLENDDEKGPEEGKESPLVEKEKKRY